MIKPIKLNYPYLYSHEPSRNGQGIPYRGKNKIGSIQESYLSYMYSRIYILDTCNRNPSDKKRLLIQKEDQMNKPWINGSYKND